MRNVVLLGAVLLAGCSQEAPKEVARAAPATLPAGTYEVTATVKSLVSTDKTPLPTFAKVGDVMKTSGCVGADGLPAPELLAAKGDQCTLTDPYVRSGRMNVTLDCSRTGQGKVNAILDGKYDAEGFTGTLTANSSFSGPGDYRLVEEITARKTGDQCTAATGAAGETKA